MNNYNVLVCLDLSATDKTLIDYCLSFHEKTGSFSKMTLVHNIRYDFLAEYSPIDKEGVKVLKINVYRKLEEQYRKTIEKANIDLSILINDSNNTAQSILKARDEQAANLIILGKKEESKGSGIIPQEILATDRKKSNVLLIPEGSEFQVEQILGAIDLSASSFQVLGTTHRLAQSLTAIPSYLYVYQMPINYFPYIDVSDQTIQKNLKEKAERKFRKFVESLDMEGVSNSQLHLMKGTHIPNAIMEYVRSKYIDLLVIGRISKNNLLGSRVGGVTRRFLQAHLDIPVWIV